MTRLERLARKELRALFERAVGREVGLSEVARRRIVNRLMRQSDKLLEIATDLSEGEADRDGAIPRVIESEAQSRTEEVRKQAAAPVFDPYAIGAVVTLQRHGADALRQQLEDILSIENLVKLASAQNLAVKSVGWSDAEELRAAIVRSAEQRLAERRAAAS